MRPGTALRIVLGECGIGIADGTCGCSEMAQQMDEWGLELCESTYRAAIKEHLTERANQASWLSCVRVALQGYLSVTDILNEAFRRCRIAQLH